MSDLQNIERVTGQIGGCLITTTFWQSVESRSKQQFVSIKKQFLQRKIGMCLSL
jgi:hypothetical protein